MHDDERRIPLRTRRLVAAEVGRDAEVTMTWAEKMLQRVQALEAGAPTPQGPTESADRTTSSAAQHGAEAPDLDILQARLEQEPSPGLLGACLERLWNARGALDQCVMLLVLHADLTPQLSGEHRQLADRIWGMAVLEETREQIVPLRSAGPAYLPEVDRVMYCISPGLREGGISGHSRGMASGLRAADADVVVVRRNELPGKARDRSDASPLRRRQMETLDGIELIRLPAAASASTRVDHDVQVTADAFVREARVLRPSLIQSDSTFFTGLPALIAARRLGIPFICEVGGWVESGEPLSLPGWSDTERFGWHLRMEAFIACEADAVLVHTTESRDALMSRGVPGERIHVSPQGVDADTTLPLPRDAAFGRAHSLGTVMPIVGFIGVDSDHEGLEVLLRAANILRGRKVQVQVALAVDSQCVPELVDYQQRNALGSRVRFIGGQPLEELPRFLSCIDIVASLFPRHPVMSTELVSLGDPLMAFAASKPAVLPDTPSHRMLVGEHQQRGLLFEPGSAESLADALQKLLEDPELRTAKGRAGRLWVVDERQWKDVGRCLRQVQVEAAAVHRAQARPGRTSEQLRIGLVAEPGLVESLQRRTDAVVLERDCFEQQLAAQKPDFVLITTAGLGADGPWRPVVDAESGAAADDATVDSDLLLTRLLQSCRSAGVPSVFWMDQEDARAEVWGSIASRADHLLTLDADEIGGHLLAADGGDDAGVISAASLSHAADPLVHHPLSEVPPCDDTFAFAGCWGEPDDVERIHQLERLLQAAKEVVGRDPIIYDDHLHDPDVLHRFPLALSCDVRGSLPPHATHTGRSPHIAHLSVSRAPESPSSFPRRAVEISASGGVVLSAASRGIAETFGGCLPTTDDDMGQRAHLRAWATDPEERLREAWLQMRSVLRSSTIETALILIARTAGIAVEGLRLPTWACELTMQNADRVLQQSVPPQAVHLAPAAEELRGAAEDRGIRVLSPAEALPGDIDWWAQLPTDASRTWAEDMLWATRWGTWGSIGSRCGASDGGDVRTIAQLGKDLRSADGSMIRALGSPAQDTAEPNGPAPTLMLTLPLPPEAVAPDRGRSETVRGIRPSVPGAGPVLIAGHDLKFARSWIEHLKSSGVEVLLDEWQGHVGHDEQRSLELLGRARTVYCEWGLGNAVWYSRNVRSDQRLVVRVHAQELTLPHLRSIRHKSVDEFIFVGELMRDAAVRSHGIPREKTRVIPNIVHAAELQLPKDPSAEFTLGMVGIIPQLKRLDRAVSVIETLASRDPRWKLRVKGRRPEEYAWMRQRKAQMRWYRSCFRRIEDLHESMGREIVTFDPHGDDMPEWFQRIGYAVSVSDRESFHLTLPDGAASGAAPISLAWPGADRIYPREWLVSDVGALAERAVSLQSDAAGREGLIQRSRGFVEQHLDQDVVHVHLDRSLLNDHDTPGASSPLQGRR